MGSLALDKYEIRGNVGWGGGLEKQARADCARLPCSGKECGFALWRDTEMPLKRFRQGSCICYR